MRHLDSFIKNALCLFVVCVVAAWLSGCDGSDVPEAKIEHGPRPLQLVIVTPHNETIREAFERGFAEWHEREHDQPVLVRWIHRGTPECVDYVAAAASDSEMALRHLAPDLMFGGGVTEHRLLAERGFARPVACPLPQEADFPKSLLGVPVVDEHGYWHASALTGFGILCHRQACSRRGVSEPKTWADLAEPAYYGWVAMADPRRSGSNRFCLDLILQRHGWEQGWGLVLRMAANCRTLLPSSEDVIRSVSSGMCLAGPSVNFAALQEAARCGDRLSFVSPTEANAITPDLITVTNYAASTELADRFVQYCLTDEGQALWSMPGGQLDAQESLRYETLFRYPVVPSFYDRYAGQLAVADNPFSLKSDFVLNVDLEQKQAKIVGPLLAAACGDNHILLQRAWKAVVDAGMPAGPLAELTKPLVSEEEAYQLGARYESGEDAEALAAEWSAKFREKYEKVLAEL